MHKDVTTGRKTLTVDEVAEILRISRNSAYEGVKNGQIPSFRVGKRILVPAVGIERMLNGTEAA